MRLHLASETYFLVYYSLELSFLVIRHSLQWLESFIECSAALHRPYSLRSKNNMLTGE